jgi:cyclopropane-fatty-acyl-phospholipid synthase
MEKMFRRFIAAIIKTGSLEIETASGARYHFGDGSGQNVRLRFADKAAQTAVVLNPTLRFGELYMDGRVTVDEGTIYDALAVICQNIDYLERIWWLEALTTLRGRLQHIFKANSSVRARRNVAHHYDLDRRLYKLFLDDDMQYSCAYFENGAATLDDAQLAKKRHIAAKLMIEKGDRVLDIGCGWGGLALYLARICGAKVTGITLSREQLAFARERAGEAGQSSGIEFRLQDYREIDERFDKIVSVGMFEHVGPEFYATYFQQVARLLQPSGMALIHTIGSSRAQYEPDPWINKYIFPGGYIPALSTIMPAIEHAGLYVTDIEILRLHYAETLRAWRARFLSHRTEAAALYDERFCRMWEYYLAASECAFRYTGEVVFQIQLARKVDTVPITRDYMLRAEAELRRRDSAGSGLRIAG